MKRLIIRFVCLVLFCYSFNIDTASCQNFNNKYAGKYKYIPDSKLFSDTITLHLKLSGLFDYISIFNNHDVGNISKCDSIMGSWKGKKNKIILNSFFQEKDYVKILSPDYEYKDSIKIIVVNYSNGNPVVGCEVSLINSGNKIIFSRKTDNDGMINIPSKGYKNISITLNNISDVKIPKLKGGYYYQFTYADCVPEIFENRELEVKKDTLIMREKIVTDYDKKGRKIYNTFQYKYVKVN